MAAFSKKKIYLAGPITGTDYNSSRFGWRKEFVKLLEDKGANHLECFSPMREKEFLEKDQCISGAADYESLHGFGTPHGILTRDHNDVRNCDAVIACFLGATRVSIGTCVEFGFAHAYRKPLIMVMEPEMVRITEPERRTERVPANPMKGGVNAIGKFLLSKGHDIAGCGIVSSHETPDGDYEVNFTVQGKRESIKNPHDHVFLRACAGYVVPTLGHAADIIYSLLTPGL